MIKISVVMPFYNSEKYIADAVRSVLDQTFEDFELIVIDDSSSDKSLEIVQHLSLADTRIKIIQLPLQTAEQKTNRLVEALNIGLEKAQGKYIARFDSDDLMAPERLAKQFSFMEQHSEVDVSGTWFQCFGDSNRLIMHPLDHETITRQLVVWCVLGHPTVIIKAATIKAYQLKYDSQYRHAEDYELWARCAITYKLRFANIPQPLLHYRTHSEQIGSSQTIKQLEITQEISKNNLRKLKFIDEDDIFTLRYYLQTDDLYKLKTIWLMILMFQRLGMPPKAFYLEMIKRKLILKTFSQTVKNSISFFYQASPITHFLFSNKMKSRTENYIAYHKRIKKNKDAI